MDDDREWSVDDLHQVLRYLRRKGAHTEESFISALVEPTGQDAARARQLLEYLFDVDSLEEMYGHFTLWLHDVRFKSTDVKAASLSLLSDGESVLDRLTATGQRIGLDQRWARAASDRGLRAIANEWFHFKSEIEPVQMMALETFIDGQADSECLVELRLYYYSYERMKPPRLLCRRLPWSEMESEQRWTELDLEDTHREGDSVRCRATFTVSSGDFEVRVDGGTKSLSLTVFNDYYPAGRSLAIEHVRKQLRVFYVEPL